MAKIKFNASNCNTAITALNNINGKFSSYNDISLGSFNDYNISDQNMGSYKTNVGDFNNAVGSINSIFSAIYTEIANLTSNFSSMLGLLKSAISDFEGDRATIQEEYKAINEKAAQVGQQYGSPQARDNYLREHGIFKPDSVNPNDALTFKNGVLGFNVTDQEGEAMFRSYNEQTNAFVAESVSSIASATMIGKIDENLTPEERDKKIEEAILATYSLVGAANANGFMSKISEDDLLEIYKEAGLDGDPTALGLNSELLAKFINEFGTDEKALGALMANGMILSGSVISQLVGSTIKDDFDKEAKVVKTDKKVFEKEEPPTNPETDPDKDGDKEHDWTDVVDPNKNPGQNPGGQNPGGQNPGGQNPGGQNPGGQNPGGQTPENQTPEQPEPEQPEPEQPDYGGTTPETDVRFNKTSEDEIPETQENDLEYTGEDIDDMAKDEFYNKYNTEEALSERRRQDIEEFENLYNKENKDELIQKFKDMGYDDAEAIGAASSREVGMAAYMLGSQNQEITNIAKDFAKEAGIEEGFDTVYDDAPDFGDLQDGDAVVELTEPSKEIVAAKGELSQQRDAYKESVDVANSSIDAANKAKSDLDSVRHDIEVTKGVDTSKWSKEDIEKYNKATDTYNTAVTRANEEVEKANQAKATYYSNKQKVKDMEDEYYKHVKEQFTASNNTENMSNNDVNTNPETSLGNSQNEQVTDDDLIDELFDTNEVL